MVLLNAVLTLIGGVSVFLDKSLVVSYNKAVGVIVIALGAFYGFVAFGLSKGKNWAWSLAVIGSILSLLSGGGVLGLLLGLLGLVILLLPMTRNYYRPNKGEINQLSANPKRLLKFFGIFFGVLIPLFAVLVFAGS